MIRFLVGRTGCGKTHLVLNEIFDLLEGGQDKIFLFVPEQQLYSAEREIFSRTSASRASSLSVLSFTRLCDLLEDHYGGRAQNHVSKATSALLMWQSMRDLKGMLKIYGSSDTVDAALSRMMLETVNELSANGISSEDLDNLANDLDPQTPLCAKLKDIASISAYYTLLMQRMCGDDPADRMIRCAEKAKNNGFFENSYIFIDSFTSFTAQEYAMLKVMLSQANEVVVTLGMDSPAGTEPQFDSARDTYNRLIKLAPQNSVKLKHLSAKQRKVSTELSFLESGLWDFSLSPIEQQDVPEEEQGHIRLMTAPTPYDEAEATALHILDLAQQDIPFGEMAIVVRDASQWKGIIDATLEQYHIPFFLSEKTDLNTKPAARLILLALRCVSRGFNRGDILSLCKTGLCNLDLRDMDYFEEYVHTWRITGRRMTQEWSMNPDGYTTVWSDRGRQILEAANRVREQIMTPLLALEVELKAAKTPTDQCKAIYEYLCALSIKKQLSAQAEDMIKQDRIREAEENVRLWSFLVETLATISTVLPKDSSPLSAEELSQVLSLIFAETNIGSIPARHDCVTVGSANLLRVDHISATFLLGLCEGEFPQGGNIGGLLSEQERKVIQEKKQESDMIKARLISDELLYVYRAMTKPSAYLYLSHSLTQADGKKTSPSSAFSRVTYLFPYLKITKYNPYWIHPQTASGYMPPMADTLPEKKISSILGQEIWLSQSEIQRYSYCPYSYFGTHIMKLRPFGEATWSYDQSGTFLHHVLEKFLRKALNEYKDKERNFGELTDHDIQETADEIIAAYVSKICKDISENGRLQHTFARLRTLALVLLQSVVNELKQSSFMPIALEWDTHGYKETDPSPLTLKLSEKTTTGILPEGIYKGEPVLLKMGGIVDRVDVYRSADGKTAYIRVVDYKSSKHEFSEERIAQKMDIQLLLYLFTLCAKQNRHLFAGSDGVIPECVLPAQAMYIYPNEDTKVGSITTMRTGMIRAEQEVLAAASQTINTEFLPVGIQKSPDGKLTGKALYDKDGIENLERLLHQIVLEQAAAIYSGNACRTPSSDGCVYCDLRSSCPVAAEKPKY